MQQVFIMKSHPVPEGDHAPEKKKKKERRKARKENLFNPEPFSFERV